MITYNIYVGHPEMGEYKYVHERISALPFASTEVVPIGFFENGGVISFSAESDVDPAVNSAEVELSLLVDGRKVCSIVLDQVDIQVGLVATKRTDGHIRYHFGTHNTGGIFSYTSVNGTQVLEVARAPLDVFGRRNGQIDIPLKGSFSASATLTQPELQPPGQPASIGVDYSYSHGTSGVGRAGGAAPNTLTAKAEFCIL